MKRLIGIIVACGVLGAAAPAVFGGWATVTVLDVPEYMEVGTPTTIQFKIRQHGQIVLWDREPSLLLPADGMLSRLLRKNRIRARKGEEFGVYEATITPEEAGELPITIDMDFLGLEAPLVPFTVVAAGGAPPAAPAHDRGRQLFVAKGCATCHAKLDNDPHERFRYADFGPSLVERTFPAEYVVMKIRNPAEGRAPTAGQVVMPRLEVEADEIEALVRFVNGSFATPEGG